MVGAGVGVVGGCVVGIGGVRKAVSRIKPAWMLAFNASKSVRCGGRVMGWEGEGVASVVSVGCGDSDRLVGVWSRSMKVRPLDGVAFIFVFFVVMV